MLLEAGKTCGRIAQADRAAVLLDTADYFKMALAAFRHARSTIHLLNWAFDPDTLLDPPSGEADVAGHQIGPFLRQLSLERPEVSIRILCWKSALFVSATQHFFPHRAKHCFADSRVEFLLDATVPFGGCHHQKVIVVDDEIAFVGSSDFCPDRWDTSEHLDHDARRTTPKRQANGAPSYYPSRHEIMAVVDGAAAEALGAVFKARWKRATSQSLPAVHTVRPEVWPEDLQVDFADIPTGVSRSKPRWQGADEVREVEALHLAGIRSARDCIFVENQYLTSPVIAEALACALAQPAGPEVILISNLHSPSWFDQMTMDGRRSLFLRRLLAADPFGRMKAYAPLTRLGAPVIVHSKLMILDDRLLRIGSANLNNRSCGFDTECELSFEPSHGDDAARTTIIGLRNRFIACWLGCSVEQVESAVESAGGVGGGIELLRATGLDRLTPLTPRSIGRLRSALASWHLGDPAGVADSWRPWRRVKALGDGVAAVRASAKAAS